MSKKLDFSDFSSALNPNWVSGFGDAESSFIISITKDTRYKSGWFVKPSFRIALHQKDLNLLKRIQTFFGVGKIVTDDKNNLVFILYIQ